MINDLTAKELTTLIDVYASTLVSSMDMLELQEIVEGTFIDEFRRMKLSEFEDHFEDPAFIRAVEIVKNLRKK